MIRTIQVSFSGQATQEMRKKINRTLRVRKLINESRIQDIPDHITLDDMLTPDQLSGALRNQR